MCKLLTVIPNGDIESAKKILDVYTAELYKEKDGASALSIGKKVATERSLKSYNKVFGWARKELEKCGLVAVHTRTATQGIVSDENTHFFEANGYYMAHNGWVSGSKKSEGGAVGFTFNRSVAIRQTDDIDQQIEENQHIINHCENCKKAKYPKKSCDKHASVARRIEKLTDEYYGIESKDIGKTASKTDSEEFLSGIEEMTPEGIEDAVDKKQFFGVALYVKKDGKNIYLSIHKPTYCLKYGKAVAFASWEIGGTEILNTYEWVHGVPVEFEESIELPEGARVAEGTHTITLEN